MLESFRKLRFKPQSCNVREVSDYACGWREKTGSQMLDQWMTKRRYKTNNLRWIKVRGRDDRSKRSW